MCSKNTVPTAEDMDLVLVFDLQTRIQAKSHLFIAPHCTLATTNSWPQHYAGALFDFSRLTT